MRPWRVLRLVLLVTLGLSLAINVAHAKVDSVEDDDDIWEDIDEDEAPAESAAKSRVSQSALVQLNDRNSERILKSNEYVMLLGYASWCRQSAAAMVEYAQAAVILQAKGSPVVLARLDAVVNTVTAGRYKIKGYPTVLFFTNGSSAIYPGGLTSEEFVNWIEKHTGHPTATISTEEQAKEILKRKQTAVVVGYFEKFEGPGYEDFVAASVEVSDVEFVQTTAAEAAGFFKPEMVKKVPSIGLFDSEDGFEQMDGPLTKDAIVTFANLYKYPMITKLHSQNVGKVYASPLKKHVILFAREDDFEDLFEIYRSAAVAFKNKLMFVWVDTADEDFAKPMLTMYGIVDSEAVVAGFDNNNGFRYLLDGEVTKESLMPWAEKYLEGQLELHYKSERIPKDNSGDVKVVVGKTFKSMVLERSTDVVLLVYTPYCYDCEPMGNVFPKVARHFKGNSSLIFGKFDASANEHPELKAFNLPAVLFYSADSLSKEPVVGPSKPYFKKLVKFVEEQHRTSATSHLSKETESSAITAEVPDGLDGISASLITDAESLKIADADSGSTETVTEVSLPTDSVIDLPTTMTGDAEKSELLHHEDKSAEAVSEVSPAEAIEIDLSVGTETPVVRTVGEEAAKAGFSTTEQRAVEDRIVKDLNEDVSREVKMADSPKDRSVEGNAPSGEDGSLKVTVADSAEAERRVVQQSGEVEGLVKDETSYKDEL